MTEIYSPLSSLPNVSQTTIDHSRDWILNLPETGGGTEITYSLDGDLSQIVAASLYNFPASVDVMPIDNYRLATEEQKAEAKHTIRVFFQYISEVTGFSIREATEGEDPTIQIGTFDGAKYGANAAAIAGPDQPVTHSVWWDSKPGLDRLRDGTENWPRLAQSRPYLVLKRTRKSKCSQG